MTIHSGPLVVDVISEPVALRRPGGRERRRDPWSLWRCLPGWGQALAVFAASRVFFTFVAHRAAAMAAPHPDGRRWNYLEIANNWDGTWYHRIVLEGYPSPLPVDAAGAVVTNTWAFYPLFPKLTGALMRVTGLDWTLTATLVSLAAAGGAVVLLRSLLERVTGPRTAIWAVVLLSFFPSSLVLQLPYSESLALLLVVAVLMCLQRHRYVSVVPLLLLLGLSRPVGVPMAVVLTVHLGREVLAVRGMPKAVTIRSLAGPVMAWLASGLAAVEWPLLVWWGTGVPDGYTRTMAAWRTPREVVPLRPWIQMAQNLLGEIVGPVALVMLFGALAWWLARRGWSLVGADLTVWCGAYAAYLLAVLDSFTSLPRYLLPMFPLGALLVSTSRSRAFRVTLTIVFATVGVVWMLAIWRSRHWAP
ncbi:MAG: hypothetical protein QG622_3673 [Actinomycetota bacterium]|nr:hypothetical protein [Actinomycetota bacterium]